MNKKVSILATGSELLDGRVVDTNSALLASRLAERGLSVSQISSCGDDLASLTESISFLLAKSEILVISGGLGPTTDDLTREAVEAFTGLPLRLNEEVLRGLEEMYARRKRPFDPANNRQAYFPETANVIPNPVGVAPGFIVKIQRRGAPAKHIVALPGVPDELSAMIDQTVLPFIAWELSGAGEMLKKHFRFFGLTEAAIGSRIATLELPDSCSISYRIKFPEIQVMAKGFDAATLDEVAAKIAAAFEKEKIFSTDPALDMAQASARALGHRSVAVCDNVTAGQIFQLLQGALPEAKLGLAARVGQASWPGAPGDAGSNQENCKLLARWIREYSGTDIGVAAMAREDFLETGEFSVAVCAGEEKSTDFRFKSRPELMPPYAAYAALNFLRISFSP